MGRSKRIRHPDRKPKPYDARLVKVALPSNGRGKDKLERQIRAEIKKIGRRVMRRRLNRDIADDIDLDED